MTESFDDLYDSQYEWWDCDEINDEGLDAYECARCAEAYVETNIPGMLRCPVCGDYVDMEAEEDDDGLWEQSSRHKTRLDREDE